MGKFLILMLSGLMVLVAGCSRQLPSSMEGDYPLKLKTLTVFDLGTGEIPILGNVAELTDSKPDFLEIEGIDYEQLSDVKFGSFRLGNNDKKVWFMVTKNAIGYWDNLYIDQNLDNKITVKEAVKTFQTSQQKKSGFTIFRADSLIPVAIRISYKGATKLYEKSLYFFISTLAESKKNEHHVEVVAFSASFLEGETKALVKNEEKLYKFMILDADSNGCFNDYGKDILFINLAADGAFHQDESEKLSEFFDSLGTDKKSKQLRMNLLPYCLELGITGATDEFDLSKLEPSENETSDGNSETASPSSSDNSSEPKPTGAALKK
ncbi:MAG TPA: hypothetical protein DDW50_12860 [Firmicutes bacterium]|jgi:hypothetical protein|nr:hypothetical protein [Bacillota bacterium]